MAHLFKYELDNLSDLENAAGEFVHFLKNQPEMRVAFYGEMGAGKTTFISAVLSKMGVDEHVSSPTFALINQYESASSGLIYHCDFYRLKNEREAFDLGVEEILDGKNWCFFEWPEKLGNLLPPACVNVKITDQNGRRIIEANV